MIPQIIHGFKFLRYLLLSSHKKGHGIHSPFLYQLIREVFLKSKKGNYCIEIDKIYERYRKRKDFISFNEIGAGSVYQKKTNIQSILKSSVSKKYGRLLFELTHFFKPQNTLELGTSVGISTMYLAKGNPSTELTSIEGVKEKIAVAKEIFSELNLQHVKFIEGNFDIVLNSVLEKFQKLDFVFFDGNHKKDKTLKYFYACLEKVHNDTLFVFDDIHWSKGMEEAWNIVIEDKKVSLSIDLFRMGLIFFKKELSKEHYVIKF